MRMDLMYSDGTSPPHGFPAVLAGMLGHRANVEGPQVLLEPRSRLKQGRQFPLICNDTNIFKDDFKSVWSQDITSPKQLTWLLSESIQHVLWACSPISQCLRAWFGATLGLGVASMRDLSTIYALMPSMANPHHLRAPGSARWRITGPQVKKQMLDICLVMISQIIQMTCTHHHTIHANASIVSKFIGTLHSCTASNQTIGPVVHCVHDVLENAGVIHGRYLNELPLLPPFMPSPVFFLRCRSSARICGVPRSALWHTDQLKLVEITSSNTPLSLGISNSTNTIHNLLPTEPQKHTI